jgi:hypothetical protein
MADDPTAIIDPAVEGTDSWDQYTPAQPIQQTPVAPPPAGNTNPERGTPTKAASEWDSFPVATAGNGNQWLLMALLPGS